MNFIDYQDSRPIYEQIAEKYKLLILKGVLEPDERMPSVRQLAVSISANPNTVQRAYAELEREGFIYTVKGRGNFVSGNASLRDKKKEELAKKLDSVLKEAEDSGLDPHVLLEEAEARWREPEKTGEKGGSPEKYVFSDEAGARNSAGTAGEKEKAADDLPEEEKKTPRETLRGAAALGGGSV